MATITITLRETGQSITATLKAAAPPPKIKDFVVDEEGYITKVSETNGDNMYRLHRKTNWDKGIKDKYITLNNGKVIEELAERRNVYKSSSGFWGEKEGVLISCLNLYVTLLYKLNGLWMFMIKLMVQRKVFMY